MNSLFSLKNTIKHFRSLSLLDQLIVVVFALIACISVWCESIGWNNPIIDSWGYFRQTWTAIDVYWMLHGGPWLAYETPLLGPPWRIPEEFPLYQWIVAVVVRLFNSPLDQTGRFVSVTFWYLTLFPTYYLLGTLGIAKTRRLIFLSLFLSCPLYLLWSRNFMIESTALFFSVAYLAAVAVALRRNGWKWASLACLLGTIGALVKITTFAGFGYAAFIFVLYDWWTTSRFKLSIKTARKHFVLLFCFALIPIFFEVIWVKYTNDLKAGNLLAKEFFTASGLTGWFFGSIAERFSSDLWIDVIYRRIIPEILGSSMMLWLCCLLVGLQGVRAKRGGIFLPVISAGLFLAVILTFTNVHIELSYYQYANAIFLVGAVGFVINSQLDYGPRGKVFGALLFVLVSTLSLRYYFHNLYPVQAENLHDAPVMQVAEAVRDMTKKDDVIVILWHEVDSTLPYYSQRKSLIDLPNTNDSFGNRHNSNYSLSVLQDRINTLQGYHIGALVTCGDVMNQNGFLQNVTAMMQLVPTPAYKNTFCSIYAPAIGIPASLAMTKNSIYAGDYYQLPRISATTLYSLDDINAKPFLGLPIQIEQGTPSIAFNGWAVDSQAKTLAAAVIVVLDDKPVEIASYGDDRPDVARVYANLRYTKSGFHGMIDTSNFKVGAYRLSLRIVNADRSGYYLGGPWKLIVR